MELWTLFRQEVPLVIVQKLSFLVFSLSLSFLTPDLIGSAETAGLLILPFLLRKQWPNTREAKIPTNDRRNTSLCFVVDPSSRWQEGKTGTGLWPDFMAKPGRHEPVSVSSYRVVTSLARGSMLENKQSTKFHRHPDYYCWMCYYCCYY